MFGISAALTTPFASDGGVDVERLSRHIKLVLAEGCASVTLFGTTGEGASVSLDARQQTLQALVAAGVSAEHVVLCLHGAAAEEVSSQVGFALGLGVQRFLLPPPCFFNQPSDQGLFDWFSSVLSDFSGTPAQFILYHIPQVTGTGLSVNLVSRLSKAFPNGVLGVKDSAGLFEHTEQLLQLPDLEILVGDERQLAACAQIGASGAISGIANLFAARLKQVLETGHEDQLINELVDTVVNFPVPPALKSLVSHRYDDTEWRRTCAPLVVTLNADYVELAGAYDAVAG